MHRTSDIRSIQAFIVVAREGNVSRAAKKLHLTQPAVSLQLKRLSEDTGLTLFSRTAKGIDLTADGELLLKKAERVMDSLADFSQAAQRLSGEVNGKLRIGTIVDPDFIRLGQLLAGLVYTYPEIQTELTHGVSGEVIRWLRKERVDAGFYLSPIYDDDVNTTVTVNTSLIAGINLRKLTEFNYKIVTPREWVAETENASWSELARLPWIGTPEDSVHSRLLKEIFLKHNCKQNIVAQVDQEPSMVAMVRSGVGLCLCRESIALHEQHSAGLSIVGHKNISAALSIATLASNDERPVIDAFFRVLDNVWTFSVS